MLFIVLKEELNELLRTVGKLNPYHKIKALCSNAWNNPNRIKVWIKWRGYP